MTIGMRIRKIRKSRKLTQKEFANMMCISQSHLSYVELGKEKPSNRFLKLLSLQLDISPEWIMTGEGAVKNSEQTKEAEIGIKQKAYISKPINIDLGNMIDIYNLDRNKLMNMVESYGMSDNDIFFITEQTEQLSLDLEKFIHESYNTDTTDTKLEDMLYKKIWDMAVSAGEDGFISGFKFAFSMFCTVYKDKP